MKSDPADTAIVAYRLRLVPSATFRTIHPDLGADHFWYRMDSCFYLNEKGRPRYPLLVQPVANGAKDNFEYILQFGREMQTDSAELVYSDRAAGTATYKFKLAY
ncbi:hypothetical protein [Mucilaginibacter conchicola]|nr:hypothetical protein [Mucilaginibacter conchicola]